MDKLGLNFGLIIAYLIPGFLGLIEVSQHIPMLNNIIFNTGGSPKQNNISSPSSILFILLLSLAIGIIINALAWAFVRPLVELTGVKRPSELDYKDLKNENIKIYNLVIENNFRYYQFYANVFVAVILLSQSWFVFPFFNYLIRNFSFFIVAIVLFLAARDSLSRAYFRMYTLNRKRGEEND